jgi:hypothetical protein
MADTDTDLTYVRRSASGADHIERPRNSEGGGSGLTRLVRATRGRQTYCGRAIGDDWREVPYDRLLHLCGTCVSAEFQEDFA